MATCISDEASLAITVTEPNGCVAADAGADKAASPAASVATAAAFLKTENGFISIKGIRLSYR